MPKISNKYCINYVRNACMTFGTPCYFYSLSDSTANLTGQNSLETQVVNQCSRAIVRNVIGKVVSPMTTTVGNDQTFTSGKPTNKTENVPFAHESNTDTQFAFIDQSAYNFVTSVSKSNSNGNNDTR